MHFLKIILILDTDPREPNQCILLRIQIWHTGKHRYCTGVPSKAESNLPTPMKMVWRVADPNSLFTNPDAAFAFDPDSFLTTFCRFQLDLITNSPTHSVPEENALTEDLSTVRWETCLWRYNLLPVPVSTQKRWQPAEAERCANPWQQALCRSGVGDRQSLGRCPQQFWQFIFSLETVTQPLALRDSITSGKLLDALHQLCCPLHAFFAVLWISIGFNADPDPGQILLSQNVEFFAWKI